MNATTSPLRTVLILLCALAVPMGLAAENADKGPPRYSVTDLGTLGGTFSSGVGVNNDGAIAGVATLSGDAVIHAFIWRKGIMTDLGTLGGANSLAPEAAPPNERGEVAGVSDISEPNGVVDTLCAQVGGDGSGFVCRPFVWRHGVMTELPNLRGNNAVAVGINNRGQASGASEIAITDADCAPINITHIRGVIWETRTGQVRELRPLEGDTLSVSQGINDKGQAVGWSGTCAAGPIEAVIWKEGVPVDLGTLGGAVGNIAFAINNGGQVVGVSDLVGDTTHHGFRWEKGVMSDLGTLHGLPLSFATAINNNGEVVGLSQDAQGDPSSTIAFLWQNGTMTDLNALIPADLSVILVEALGINDRGQITGVMLDIPSGESHGFLATPVEGSESPARAAQARSGDTPRVVLPEKVREMLRHQHRWPGRGK